MHPTLQEQEEAFAGTFFDAVLGAQLTQTAYIGHKLGWYMSLKDAGESNWLDSSRIGHQDGYIQALSFYETLYIFFVIVL